MRSKAYAATDVKKVQVSRVIAGHEGEAADLGLDVSKDDVKLMLRWQRGSFAGVWRARNPQEIPLMVQWMTELAQGRVLRVAMEPTGTYGDALRQAMHRKGLALQKVPTKASHDYAEIFDGVPSQHDGKDAAIVAELCALGKSSPWPYELPSAAEQRMAELVEWMDVQRKLAVSWLGRLEALLARHWPEATGILDLKSMTLLRALMYWGGPGALACDPQAAERLRRGSGSLLKAQTIQQLLDSARQSLGVDQTPVDVRRMRRMARRARAAVRVRQQCRAALKQLAQENATIQAMGRVVGMATACVLWVCLGNPLEYSSAYAYRKALGLNLAERSSGRWQGQLKISKRGSAMGRRWLYLAALRTVRTAPAGSGIQLWYEQHRSRWGGRAGRALTGIMRKLSLAVFTAAAGEVFQPERVFVLPAKAAGRR